MQTLQINIHDDKLDTFLTIIENLKGDIIESIRYPKDILDIEAIHHESDEYREVMEIKANNNQKYSIKEAREKLGLS
jgi:hypothetical protein